MTPPASVPASLPAILLLRALYAVDATGEEHFLGPVTDAATCVIAAQMAPLDRPAGIRGSLGPPPWRFECRPEDRFKPGWDQIK